MHVSSHFFVAGLSLLLHHGTACHDIDLEQFATNDYRSLTLENTQARSIGNARFARRADIPKIAIKNVRVFDGNVVQDPSTIIIDGETFGSDETDAVVVDGKGGFVIPGLIDSHCHPTNTTDLEDLTRYGVTTAFSMACYSAAMCESLKGHRGIVDIKTSTAPAAAPGSVHGNISQAAAIAMHNQPIYLNDSAQASTWLANQISWQPDVIKAIAESPGLDQATLNAVAQGARGQNKLSVCHATAYAAYQQAVTAGFSQVHHTPLDQPVDSNIIQAMIKQNQISSPTLAIMKALAQKLAPPSYAVANATVHAIHSANIPILAGTDANSNKGIPANVPFGTSLHEELELLVGAGLSTLEALRAATINPAQHYGLNDRGVIAPGKRADFILLGSNPIENITATRDIRGIWVAGIKYEDSNPTNTTGPSTTNSTSPSANYTGSSTTSSPPSTTPTIATNSATWLIHQLSGAAVLVSIATLAINI